MMSQNLQPWGCTKEAEAGSPLPEEPQDQALAVVDPGESSCHNVVFLGLGPAHPGGLAPCQGWGLLGPGLRTPGGPS